ncbi:MAG TPA: carboxypeptidase-like regulatory domain-containing protein, partial [Terriglobales bacterium]|nr:carboxypeptidase-like regulatory domain-containing protein [Terriglobales bacterium]
MSNKRARTVLILIACMSLVSAAPLYGQAVNGTLLGTLIDSSGAVVPSAQVTIIEIGTGINHTTESNGSGNYVFPNLPPGNYSVTAEAHGFKKQTRAD